MDLDPSLAFTAILEMMPARMDLKSKLADAMSAANPPDRWAFAKAWLAEHAADPVSCGCWNFRQLGHCIHTA